MNRRKLGLSLSAWPLLGVVAAFAPSVGAAEPPPVAQPAAQPPPVSDPRTVAPTAATPSETSKEVLRLYVAQEDAQALQTVRAGLERCERVSRHECPDVGKALLLRDHGIVLAGAYRDHAGAVAAFQEGLRLDPTLTIPPDLLVDRVRQAFVQAGGTVAPPAGSPAPAVAPAPGVAEAAEVVPPGPRYDVGDTFLLAVGSAGWAGDGFGQAYGDFRLSLAGHWHVAGPLVVGVRVSGGSTSTGVNVTTLEQYGPFGVLGAAAMIGFLPRGKRNTGYMTFGIGPDWVPELGRARAVFSFAGGASLGGFVLGGMPAITVEQDVVGGAFIFFLGWGNYVKD